MQPFSSAVPTLLVQAVRRYLLEESIPRAVKCLDMLSEEDIWFRPNGISNSPGNLVLHLCGNATQWILSTLGPLPDHRNRDAEFAERGPIPRENLQARLWQLAHDLEQVLASLDEEALARMYRVQGFEESGVTILVHVTEHFSYHVGQLTWFVKAHTGRPTGYYEGVELNTTAGDSRLGTAGTDNKEDQHQG